MKQINTSYYNNNNIEGLTFKNNIVINSKTINIIKLFWRAKNSKTLIKEEIRQKKLKLLLLLLLLRE